jgi:hypothetical protein
MGGDRSCPPEVRIPSRRPHMRFDLSLPDNDVFSGQSWNPGVRGGQTLQFTMSSCQRRLGAELETCCFPRSLGRLQSWWSQTGSNRRPHACKARALPTELWPLGSRSRLISSVRPRCHTIRGVWWAQADSNCRPHAYQACALTN